MKFRIDTDKLSAEIKEKRGYRSYMCVAKEIGVSQSTVICAENGGSRISAIIYASICHWLGVSLAHFLIESE